MISAGNFEFFYACINRNELVKTLNVLANVIPALDNNTQGQATAGIQ
jgi:hypothetical protein